jgi:hypothetical protein
MKSFKSPGFFPCATFFGEGRTAMGVLVLLLQATLVFWPLAARLARRETERTGIEELLNELSEANRKPEDAYRYADKRFRQAV